MSFLAPLFLAGILAVSLPILFHLIRRTPRGRVLFSSLMFLSPSPPRVTRRSRLEHWVLLLLRSLAVILLALAFARPFLWEQAAVSADTGNIARRIVVLVDTSASMSRENLWQKATLLLMETVDNAGPTDKVAVFAFDRTVNRLVTLDAWAGAPPGQRDALVDDAMAGIKPTKRATDLGAPLVAAAEALHEQDAGKQSFTGPRQVVLISDVPQGSDVRALDAYDWPEDVTVQVKALRAGKPTNAGIQFVLDREAVGVEADKAVRLRVTNAKDSERDRFQVEVEPKAGTPTAAGAAESVEVYVPAGESRVVRLDNFASLLAQGGTLRLRGDDAPFDNEAFRVASPSRQITVAYFGDDKSDDASGLHYYLTRAFLPTPGRTVNLHIVRRNDVVDTQQLNLASLLVVGDVPSQDQIAAIRSRVESGATVLIVMREVTGGQALAQLLNLGNLPVREAAVSDYAMLAQIDFKHPLFAPFSDPRFGDFTKTRFWKHRTIDVDAAFADSMKPRVLARFDDESPAIVEATLGQGTLLILATSWAPEDGQLALSSKFVPLLNVLLEQSERLPRQAARVEVGDPVDLTWAVRQAKQRDVELSVTRLPDAKLDLSADGVLTQTDEPGLYEVAIGQEKMGFAVSLAAAESETSPLPLEELEKRGVKLFQSTPPALAAAQADKARQMRMAELENRHKLWRWLLVAALAVLALESWLAGWFATRTPTGSDPASVAPQQP